MHLPIIKGFHIWTCQKNWYYLDKCPLKKLFSMFFEVLIKNLKSVLRPASEIRFFSDFLYKTKIGDPWWTGFSGGGGGGLEGANKNKIGPKTSKSAKNRKNRIPFLTRKCLNRLLKKIFFTRKGLHNMLG